MHKYKHIRTKNTHKYNNKYTKIHIEIQSKKTHNYTHVHTQTQILAQINTSKRKNTRKHSTHKKPQTMTHKHTHYDT